MKNIYITVFILFAVVPATIAQNYQALNSFLTKYSDNYVSECFGQSIPEYNFSPELSKQKLSGKVVILDFWATWCGACHDLGHDLDSILVKGQFGKSYQIIGINYKESKHQQARTGGSDAYWRKNGYGFPMVEGIKAEQFGERLNAGHPTLILVDGDGIIRGRWDSYTPTTVPIVQAAVWIITNPDEKFDKELLRGILRNHDWPLALFITEQLTEDEEVFWAKLRALLHVSEWDAYEYVQTRYNEIATGKRKSEDYEEKLWNIMGEIVEAKVLSSDLNKFGLKLFDELCLNFEGYREDYIVLDYASRLYWRIGQKEKARECNDTCLKICKKKNINSGTIEYFEKVAKDYQQ